MLFKFFFLLNLVHNIISIKLLKINKGNNFFIKSSFKKLNKKYIKLQNESYFGSKYLFNEIFNDNLKHKGDNTSNLLQRAHYIIENNTLFHILPLGLRVINKIINLINKHLLKLNSHLVNISILQNKKLWLLSDRLNLYNDEFLYVYKQKKSKNKKYDMSKKKNLEDDGNILSPTCEEISLNLIHSIYNENISIKYFPILIHQFQYKFRNEKRLEKSLFKSKEFLMKDGYSFHSNESCLDETYELYKECYKNIFEKLKLPFHILKRRKKDKMNALESHEYQILCKDNKLKEVAHIFKLGDYYSQKMNILYLNKKNEKKHIYMGSYGIGIYRLLYFLVDHFYDKDGIKLPEDVSPFTVYLIQKNQRYNFSYKNGIFLNNLKSLSDNIVENNNFNDISKFNFKLNLKYENNKENEKKLNETKQINNIKENINDNIKENINDISNNINLNKNKISNDTRISNINYTLNIKDIEYILTLWLYNVFKKYNIDTYYDDTYLHFSRKLKHCDLIGASNRIIVNLINSNKENNIYKKIINELPFDFYKYINNDLNNILNNKLYLIFKNTLIEYKNRFSSDVKMMTIHELFKYFKII